MLKNYLKIATKVLLRRKFFTFVSLFGISFTLIVLMVVAAMLDNVLSPQAPEVNLNRTLHITHVTMSGESYQASGSPGFLFLDRYCRDLPGVEVISIFTQPQSAVGFVAGRKLIANLRRTDGAYWDALRFQFLEGHAFTEADNRNGSRVAVITRDTRSRFLGEGSALGKTIEVDGQSFTVIGVVENVPQVRFSAYADIFVPTSTSKSDSYRELLMGGFNAILVANSRSRFDEIRAEFAARMPHVELTDPVNYNKMQGEPKARLDEIADDTLGTDAEHHSRTRQLVLTFVLSALLFMLLPAINLVNINISRIYERASEIGVRKAFGASSLELVGQFVIENVLLSLVGGAIGLVGSFWVLEIINNSGVLAHAQFAFNPRIFLYAVTLAVFFGMVSGVYPAWRMSRLDPVNALRGARQ